MPDHPQVLAVIEANLPHQRRTRTDVVLRLRDDGPFLRSPLKRTAP